MKQQEILKYNKRCAEFLGWKIVDGIITLIPEESEFQHEVGYSANGFLKFHSDWNWIMEVVDAIEKKVAWVNIKGCAVDISSISNVNAKTKKEAVVQAINQFLIWYNEN